MSRWKAAGLALALAVLVLGGLVALFNADFAGGNVYPEDSTLRADPKGAKLLFDGLARLPGITAVRNFLPVQNLPANGSTVVLLDLHGPDLEVIEKMAHGGDRVVAALREDWKPEPKEANEIFKQWHVRLATTSEKDQRSRLYFSEAEGWTALEREGAKLIAVERAFGTGTVALLASSSDFSNRSSVASGRLPQVTAALGDNARIVFDESHLGIAESGSVMGLARRFRMTGFTVGLAICAALFIWRNASAFPPPELAEKETVQHLIGRTSAAGLLTLLRKNVTPRELIGACFKEWLAGRRREFSAERIASAEAIARAMAGQPLEAAREIHSVLHSKGTL